MTLIRINNRFVNLDHVVEANYTPARSGGVYGPDDEDGDAGKEYPARSSRMELSTRPSGTVVFTGAGADKLYELLSSPSVALGSFTVK
jgi:hypothetical protein